MTGVLAPPARRRAWSPTMWLAALRRRIREPAFWRVQALVAAVTALHVTLDRQYFPEADLWQSVHHIPVILYLAPVAYAGLVYGFEGGVLTGLWCGALASVNIVVWHRADFAWTGEMTRVVVVMGMGVLMALPVERERRQRRHAEENARRLALLNGVAAAAARFHDLDSMVAAVLAKLHADLHLACVCLRLRRRGDVEEHFFGCEHTPLGSGCVLADGQELPPGSVSLPIDAGKATATLLAVPATPTSPTPEDRELLGAIAAHLGVVIENALLHREEREHLQSYVQLVTRAQEDERTRIARDLHDETAQQLVLLCRGLDDLENVEAADGDRTDDGPSPALAPLRDLAAASLAGVRRFARDLRPSMLDDLGLVPAIEWLVSDLAQRTGVQARFDVQGTVRRLAAETEVALFRVAQEAIRNTERHADAGAVDVGAAFTGQDVRLVVHDDGKGFVPPERVDRAPAGSLGIMGMRERVELVGGVLQIESSPGSGTTVTAQVPEPATA